MSGEVGILNVGAGDTKLSFDPKNPVERVRAARIVRDMLRRGYVLLVKVGEDYRRAEDFDESTCEYIIADLEAEPVHIGAPRVTLREEFNGAGGKQEAADANPQAGSASPGDEGAGEGGTGPRRGRRKRLPAESTNAVAVGRTAGG